MDEFWNDLLLQMKAVESIGDKIERGEAYLEELNGSLPALNKIINGLFELLQTTEFGLEISTDFILQVLNDILYGIENEDAVFLLDVLRYGLLSVFYYIISELQSGGIHEQTSL